MAPGGGRDFRCTWPQCGKNFNRKSDLIRHHRIHTNERPYRCTMKDCNKSFIQRSALTVHLRTHTGEKPHVCDHDGCRKAFSDSSSLARHRRIHTGKRPYICQEPACERTFCRKTTLTKHRYRSHPPVSLNRQPSEDATSEQSYQAPIAASMPNDQYLLAQQPFYPQQANPNPDFYAPNLPITHVTIPETTAVVAQSMPIHHVAEVQQAQHMQMMHRYEQNRQPYVVPGYPQQQVPGHFLGGQLMAPYNDFQYKAPTRLLNQPEGTDWGFLGVG